jgi:hypothetical protein
MSPKNVLDASVVVGGLLVCWIAISVVDHFETSRMMAGTTTLAPWQSDDSQMNSLDRSFFIVKSSFSRWLFFHLPSLALLLGALVGLASSGWRRAWLVAAAALSPLPIMALAFLIDVPLAAVFFACLPLVIGVASATAASFWLNRIKGR